MTNEYEPRHATEVGVPLEYQKPPSLMFSNRTYDMLKWVAQILLPALGTFVFTVGLLWGFPEDVVGKIVGTIVAVDTLLGLLLGLSNRSYEKSGVKYDGAVSVQQISPEAGKFLALDLNVPPEVLEGQKEVVLKVEP